jgi:hypothetical protein
MTDPTSRQRGRPIKYRTTTYRYLPSKGKQHLVTSPRVGSTPRRTDWQTVNHKITLTFTWPLSVWSSSSTQWNVKLRLPASPLASWLLERSYRVTAIRTNRSAHRPVETSSSSSSPKQRWTPWGQREYSVCVRVTTSSSPFCPKQRLALSRSTRTCSVCACNHI